jgi:hypothetical protein
MSGSSPSSTRQFSRLSTSIRMDREQWPHSVLIVTASDSFLRCPCTKGMAKVSIAQGE